MSRESRRIGAVRARGPVAGRRLLLAASASLLLAACASGGEVPPAPPQASGTAAASSAGSTQVANYQMLMVFYAAEFSISSVIDPMMFVAAPGTPAAVGPLLIRHVAGIAPPKRAGSPTSPLLGADGTPLGITLGQWEKAAGTVAFSCVGSKRQATSTLTGLVPSATYSTFAVHATIEGPGRFTPWGDPAGATNNVTASATGTASPTNTVDSCFGNADNIIIIWHSDGVTHGKSPGRIGVNWHTSLITRVP